MEQLETEILDQANVLKELKKANSEIKKLQKKLNIRSGSESPFGLSYPFIEKAIQKEFKQGKSS